MSDAEKFDDDAYRHGRASFEVGMSLREAAEIIAAEAAGAAGDAKTTSFALGFADGALTALRAALNMVPPPTSRFDP